MGVSTFTLDGVSIKNTTNTKHHEAHWAGFEPKTQDQNKKRNTQKPNKNENTKTAIRELNPRPPETTARLLEHNGRRDGPVVLGFGSNPAQCASWCFVLVVFLIVFLAAWLLFWGAPEQQTGQTRCGRLWWSWANSRIAVLVFLFLFGFACFSFCFGLGFKTKKKKTALWWWCA